MSSNYVNNAGEVWLQRRDGGEWNGEEEEADIVTRGIYNRLYSLSIG